MTSTSFIDNLCCSTFWDSNLTWHSEIPSLTPCFEKTVLTWLPGLLLLVLLPLDFWWVQQSTSKNIPWSWLSVTKTIILGLMMGVSFIDTLRFATSSNKYLADIISPVVQFLISGTLMTLVLVHKSRGIRASYTTFICSLALLVCHTLATYSVIVRHITHVAPGISSSLTSLVMYVLLCVFFILQWFCDKPAVYSKYPDLEKPNPELSASIPSRISLSWFTPLVRLGIRKPLETSDMPDLEHNNSARVLIPKFQAFLRSQTGHPEVVCDKQSAKVKFSQNAKRQISIIPALLKTCGPFFFLGSLCRLISDIMNFANPQMLKLVIQFVSSEDSLWKGCMYAAVMYIVAVLQILFFKQYFIIMNITGMRITTALISAIYKKSLKQSNAARKNTTVGELVNLMSVDVQTFPLLMIFINYVWAGPLQIGIAMFFLWQLLGPAALAGLGVMLLMMPLNGWLVNKVRVLRAQQMKYKDERIKIINEVLSGIKVLKLYAWEESFEQKINNIRQNEINVLKTSAIFNSVSHFFSTITPYVVAVSTFAFFVLYDEHNILDAETAFVSLALFNILRIPLSMFTQMWNNFATTAVATKRINKFLNSEEIDTTSVTHDNTEHDQVVIEDGTFSWDKSNNEEIVLRDINLRVPVGALVAIVGSVGSGKSSLLSAILGELDKISGRVNTKGKVAYVPQQAWIQNVTLRRNITGQLEFDKAAYRKIVKACALEHDIDILPGGDLTEIGEKGINLSGGQKQRVSLARAVYSKADLYLLDDPLSAVDSHVGKHIFENVIGPRGTLCKTTRLLVTHGVSFLREADLVVVMKGGRVSECGTYKQLIGNEGDFADFLLQHLEDAQDSDGDNGIEEVREEMMKDASLQERYMRAKSVESHHSGKVKRTMSNIFDSSKERALNQSKTSLSKEQMDVKPNKVGKNIMTVEESQTGKVKLSVFIYYLRSLGLPMAVTAAGGMFLYQTFLVSANLWLSKWSSDKGSAVNGTQDKDKTHVYLGVYAALGIGQAVTNVVACLALSLGCLAASSTLHSSMLQRVLRAPMSFFDTTPLGRVLNRFSGDLDICDCIMPFNLQQFLSFSLQTLAIIAVITYSTPPFIIAIIPIFIINFYFQRLYVATSRQLKRLESTTRSPIYSHFGETVQGVQSIRAYGLQEAFTSECEKRVDFCQMSVYPNYISQRWLGFRLEVVGNLILFFAALFAVMSRGSLDSGLAGLSVTYALQIVTTINFFTKMTADVETNLVSVERIKDYTEVKQEAVWTGEAELNNSWPAEGRIEFCNYSVRYREGLDLVLNGVSFTVMPGERVGIVGRTGAGKSSLTLALFRLLEAAGGSIIIDGRDIATVGLHQLRSRLTIIPQDPVLLSGTLRNNLDPLGTATDKTLWKVLELSNLKSFVKNLPSGLDYPVSEGGDNLSVGQKQLVCLARALLRKSKLLVLDEATAAVDLETDSIIQQTIRNEFQSCTVLTIAHRLHTIMDYDRILVLEKGRVEEYDTPSTLLQDQKSIFYSMAQDAGIVA